LSRFLKVAIVDVGLVRIYNGMLFHAVGPATHCRVVALLAEPAITTDCTG